MNDIIQEFQAAFFRQRQRLRRYTALLVALALVTTLFVNWQLHSDGIAKTADYQCNLEEHEHTADCYPLVLVCGYEEGQPEDDTSAAPEEDSALDESFDVPEPVFVPHVHTDDCYQDVVTEVPVLTCYQEEHLHTDDCFDPEDGTLLCGLFEHTHSEEEGCYTMEYETTRELVCGYEEGELVEEAPSACTDAAAFADAEAVLPAADEAPQPAEPVLHHHTEACYAPDYTAAPLCGLEEHHHTVNCLADPLADVEDESDWLAKTNTALSGNWSADLLAVAQSQLGYTQSEKNFELDTDDGQTVRHYTRYGQWYGNPYGSWDVMFLSYCLNYAGIPQSAIPQRAGTQALRSDLRATGYLMDPQSIPAAQQDAIALCDEEMTEEEGFADAADDLGFADSASSFRSIRPGDIVFYNAAVTETVAAENEPQIETLSLESDADADTGDPVLSSLSTPADPPRTEQRTTVSETLGIVSDVDETSDTLTVISGNVDGKVDTVQVGISQLTGLISLAAVQEEESSRAAASTEDVSGLDGKVNTSEQWKYFFKYGGAFDSGNVMSNAGSIELKPGEALPWTIVLNDKDAANGGLPNKEYDQWVVRDVIPEGLLLDENSICVSSHVGPAVAGTDYTYTLEPQTIDGKNCTVITFTLNKSYIMVDGNPRTHVELTYNTYLDPNNSALQSTEAIQFTNHASFICDGTTIGDTKFTETVTRDVVGEQGTFDESTGSLKVSNLWQDFSGNTITDAAQLSTFGAVTVTLTKHSQKATVTFVGTDGASYSYRVGRGAVITVSGHWSDGSHTIAAETSGNAALSYSTDGTVRIKDITGDVTVQVNTSISGGFADNVSVADGVADGKADGVAGGEADGEAFTRDLGSIQLNSGNHWTHTWTGLESSADVWYTVEEVAMEGYKTSYTVNGAAVQEGSTPSIILSAAEGSHVQILNQSTQGSYELPSTGGAGTTLYTAVGGTMVLAALVCGLCQKRRRERRAD